MITYLATHWLVYKSYSSAIWFGFNLFSGIKEYSQSVGFKRIKLMEVEAIFLTPDTIA